MEDKIEMIRSMGFTHVSREVVVKVRMAVSVFKVLSPR